MAPSLRGRRLWQSMASWTNKKDLMPAWTAASLTLLAVTCLYRAYLVA